MKRRSWKQIIKQSTERSKTDPQNDFEILEALASFLSTKVTYSLAAVHEN